MYPEKKCLRIGPRTHFYQKFRVVGGFFDFRVTPNPNDLLDLHLDEEFDNHFTS